MEMQLVTNGVVVVSAFHGHCLYVIQGAWTYDRNKSFNKNRSFVQVYRRWLCVKKKERKEKDVTFSVKKEDKIFHKQETALR